MNSIHDLAAELGIANGSIAEIQAKDGVFVYRVTDLDASYILKYFAKEADRREILNYEILRSLGIPTLKIISSTNSALLMEDISQSETLRLGRPEDMHHPALAQQLAAWYKTLHREGKAYVKAYGENLYDEADVITPENMEYVAKKTGTGNRPVWALLHRNFNAVVSVIASIERTLTYNDFYYTNMIVARDHSAAFMFDYNLLGKGYAYADIRNVTYQLGSTAKEAFLSAYGQTDSKEITVDAVASVLTTLYFACLRPVFPRWAEAELQHLEDGTLEHALRRLLADAN